MTLCHSPQLFRGKEVPCGRCSPCLDRKRSIKKWLVRSRIIAETAVAPRTWFVTLTLRSSLSDGVAYRIVQRWLRRMRKAKVGPLRYACVAELGSRGTKRLHYHVVLHGPISLTERQIRKHWRGGISQATLIRSSDAQAVGRYSVKMAGYTAKGAGRFRFSLGYGSQALVRLCNPVVQAVRYEWPTARVRIGGVVMPWGLLPAVPGGFVSRWSDSERREAHETYVAFRNERKPRRRLPMKRAPSEG